jgi:hypothetical protein
MSQLEIEYFWPLTEQISLDLDFSKCSPYQYHMWTPSIAGLGKSIINSNTTWSSSLHIDGETITFNNLKMPWYRKTLFKLMGFKWKK